MNCHTWKSGTDRHLTMNVDRLSREDVQHLRWLYRYLRRSGVGRVSARMALHSAYHLGYRVGHDVGYTDSTEMVRNQRAAS